MVRQSWSTPVTSRGMRVFQQKLVQLKLCLKSWNKDVFGNVFQRVRVAEEEVAYRELFFYMSQSAEDRFAFSKARARLPHALSSEETFLRQQSGI